MTHASLCTGIGACELAATWMGWENLFSCEIDEFCNKVLKHHYPKATHYGNIFEQDFREWRGRVDVLTAGFPCQPFSCAGKRNGAEDDRYLWPEVLRVINEVRPTWFIGENVGGIITMVLPGEETKVGSYTDVCGENYTFYEKRQRYVIEQIRIDLASIGYSVQPVVIPACAIGAPHRRDRVWFLARRDDVTDTDGAGLQETGTQQRATGVAGDGLQRDVANPNGYRFRIRENKQKHITECQGETNDRSCRKDGITSHSQRIRSDEVHEDLQPEQPDGKGITLVSSERYATDTESTGIKGERDKGQGKIQFNRRDLQSVRPSWQNFPTTEPAIRRGDDGISGRLSGITFSRWRQESIKALGNSMVPPLVYEIFLAIEKVEQIK
jgi:DNA (cytosine-5)-methyltransferase 1|nr:MAG TPA: Cytosine specific methyltransferase [Caudoviricetes sp.]